MAEAIVDKRFAHIARDPKFKRIPKNERKIKIDKRFQSMFNDDKFAIKYTVDKRGKPINQTSMENLQKYYHQESSSEDESDTEIKLKTRKSGKKANNKIKHDESDDTIEKEKSARKSKAKEDIDENLCIASSSCTIDLDEELKENEKQLNIKKKDEHLKLTNQVKERLQDLSVNYARGEGILVTDSSSDEETSEYSDEDIEDIEHGWGELDKDAETTDEITRRLAVCNMNWDRIRAVDLMVLFHSFLPSGGIIHSVTIYPSEFGLERMKEEEIKGPVELVDDKIEEEEQGGHSESESDSDSNEEGSSYHMEKLRKYQLNRLKYYYAVLECDSAETANKIYTDCDGIEYECTATRLDLRFIPDDMTFDQEPREVCTELPEISKYQPRQFVTTALQQAKVQLTWDETNPDREELANKLNSGKVNEINEKDLQAYLASGTSDDDTDNEIEQNDKREREDQEDSDTPNDPIEKYKSLLKQLDEEEEAKKNKDVELEFTWGIGTEEKEDKLAKDISKKTEEDLAPFEKYLAKRKIKQKARKEEIKKRMELRDDDASNSDNTDVNIWKNNKLKNGRLSRNDDDDDDDDDDSSFMENEETKRSKELELLLMDETENENKKHFDMNKIEANTNLSKSKRKRLKKKQNVQNIEEDDFQVNVNDARFSALFTSHNFNIDPADPHYRKTKGTDTFIQEKLKRRAQHIPVDQKEEKMPPENNKKLKLELQALVKSVKRNTNTISQSIKR
ncbi:PREDICTED: ESF1 homolog isoform X2 [Polistes dominula]|uniref:ESF1 homolog isoform X2 n=1 Tax=Polistes dominula TaxID=743375 RepID=A0ABM1IX69_POLDO|nr:PREDICTED: ESF1 homolog isoform X2 [Polistes dominula]